MVGCGVVKWKGVVCCSRVGGGVVTSALTSSLKTRFMSEKNETCW